jgi:hypothetical protein
MCLAAVARFRTEPVALRHGERLVHRYAAAGSPQRDRPGLAVARLGLRQRASRPTGRILAGGGRMVASAPEHPTSTAHAGAPSAVVLTIRSARGVAILEALHDARVRVDAVVLDRGDLSWRASIRKLRRSLRRGGLEEAWRRVARRSQRILAGRGRESRKQRPASAYRAFADAVYEIADPNSEAGLRLLKELAPDLLVLGSARIVAPRVITVPPMGVLNAHPGLLPDYRGVDVIPWALRNGDPLGVSVHYVDAGIDTGDVVAQCSFDVRPGDTLQSLTRHATAMASRLTPTRCDA